MNPKSLTQNFWGFILQKKKIRSTHVHAYDGSNTMFHNTRLQSKISAPNLHTIINGSFITKKCLLNPYW